MKQTGHGFLVAFDIDGTLLDLSGNPRYEVLDLLRSFQALKAEVIVWSGGGVDYAKSIVRRLGLKVTVLPKGSLTPDIAIDDMDATLGKTNFLVNE